jgi:hypothetical protein
MSRLANAATLALVCLAQSACADVPATAPASVRLDRTVNGVAADRVVKMRDQCDPATFNAVLGPNTCVRDAGGPRVTFAEFNAELARRQEVNAWRFNPPETTARTGDVLLAVNEGGEAHTFTKVAQFGGGFVTPLNAASGNPVPAPECLDVPALHIVPPGGSDQATVGASDTELYQCCIHPWMRTVVHVNHHG